MVGAVAASCLVNALESSRHNGPAIDADRECLELCPCLVTSGHGVDAHGYALDANGANLGRPGSFTQVDFSHAWRVLTAGYRHQSS